MDAGFLSMVTVGVCALIWVISRLRKGNHSDRYRGRIWKAGSPLTFKGVLLMSWGFLVILCNLSADRLSAFYAWTTVAFFMRLDDDMLHGLGQGASLVGSGQ